VFVREWFEGQALLRGRPRAVGGECGSVALGFLRSAAREVAGSQGALSEREFAMLLAELVDLPCLDLSLQVELPTLL
jgi:hypothetical protein